MRADAIYFVSGIWDCLVVSLLHIGRGDKALLGVPSITSGQRAYAQCLMGRFCHGIPLRERSFLLAISTIQYLIKIASVVFTRVPLLLLVLLPSQDIRYLAGGKTDKGRLLLSRVILRSTV